MTAERHSNDRAEQLNQRINLRFAFSFREGKQQAILEGGEVPVQWQSWNDLGASELLSHIFVRHGKLNDQLVEAWPGIEQPQGRYFLQLGQCVLGFGNVLGGYFPDSFLAQKGAIDCRHQREEALVGADVGRGLFAADVLFAC